VDWDFPATVLDVVKMGLYRSVGLFGRLKGAPEARARNSLERVGMVGFADRQIGQLSGGQQQRVFLARALAQGADLYLLDEPFAGVDAATERAIVDVLKTLKSEGKTVIAVHHDLATVAEYFDRVFMINVRPVAEGPVSEAFKAETLVAAYDDAKGVTGRFNLNLLTRLNHEAGAEFDLETFRHKAIWNATASRIEMHLESLQDQNVRLGDHSVAFFKGETIHTENSYKFSVERLAELATQAGWRLSEVLTDENTLFAVTILRRD